jgi:hypothetical protein
MTQLIVTPRDATDAPPAEWAPDARPEPAPIPRTFTPELDGAAVLDEARAFLASFWISPSAAALDIMTLWACHAWVTDEKGKLAFYTTPRIAFVSDQPKSGKSRALELLALLVPNAEHVIDPTAPALLKAIAERNATLCVDEIDQLFGMSTAAKAVRAILNAGYRKGASVSRVNVSGDTFAPVALAGLASSFMANPTLEPTRTRCIIIRCERPPAGVKPAKYREQLHAGLGALIGHSLGQWARANVMDIITAWPDMPDHLDGRDEDVWQDLFSVAHIAGGHWPQKVAAACEQFTRGTNDGTPELPPRARLIRDIRAVWPDGADRMTSAALMQALAALPGAPWASLWSPVVMIREVPALAGLTPDRVTVDGRQVQGYHRTQIDALG